MNGTSVEGVGLALLMFGAADYVVFVFMLLMCAAIGVYYGFFAGQVTADDYLMGGRTMKVFPVSMSLIASFISGIILLGIPTEMYLYGSQYVYIGFAVVLTGIAMCVAYLPVLHELQLTSTYEYLELRFSRHVRLFCSILFVLGMIIWIPIVIYVPALAFNQVTGVNVHIITPVVCLVCIFYTCVGGMKAVVWTDVVQTIIMFGAMMLVIIKGTMDIGGPSVVWQRNMDSGRLEAPNLSVDPLERHTLMVLVMGGFFQWLSISGMSQTMQQRYLSLATLNQARAAVWIFLAGTVILIGVCCYCGMLIYATYYDCDPLTTKLAHAKDQLLPLLVMQTLGEYPGLQGCFVAGVFSAALSSMSTALNSMAAVILEDFCKAFRSKPLTGRQTNIIMRSVVLISGSVCVVLVFVVENLGSVLQMNMSLGSMTFGPSLGIFSAGLFLPWVTTKGILVGGSAGLGFMSWIVLGAQTAIATGHMRFKTKPLTVEGCTYNFVVRNTTMGAIDPYSQSEVFPLFRMSYLLYTMIGCLMTMLVSLLVSFLTGANDISSMDHRLLSPVIRRFLPRQKSGALPNDSILASGYKSVELQVITQGLSGDHVVGQEA